MSRQDKLVIVSMLILASVFGLMAATEQFKRHQEQQRHLYGQVLQISPIEVIGQNPDYEGDPKSPFTLVEFGDYECPPCHAAFPLVQNMLKKYQGKVKFVFRNLPLVSIHPYAMSAAMTAVLARKQGQFWPVHDALYEIDPVFFNQSTIRSLRTEKTFKLKPANPNSTSVAKALIMTDIQEAAKLNINSTPTFLLCRPNGEVDHMNNLDQIEEFL